MTTSPMAAALAMVVLFGVACGVPTDSAPNVIANENLPAGLASSTPTPTPEVAESPQGVDIDVFLIDEDGALTAVQRVVPQPVLIEDVINTLIATGEDETLQADQLRSFVPPSTVVAALTLDGAILTIDFGIEGFAELELEQQLQALAQIVYTATALDSVDGVLLSIEGNPRPLPTDGEDTDGQTPVDRDDYASFA